MQPVSDPAQGAAPPGGPAATPPRGKPLGGGMGAKALLVSGATMVSRVLGLVREQLFAALLGATMAADAFVVAFRIPNLLRDLFAEGALSAAFVPTYADHLRNRGQDAAVHLARVVITVLILVTGALTLLGVLFAEPLVRLIAPGFAGVAGKVDLAAECTRIMMPFLLLVSLAAVAMGQLNAQERFGPPAFASAVFNVITIAGGVVLYVWDLPEIEAVIGWSVFTLVGGVGQLAIQLPALRATGFRFRPALELAHPGLRRMVRLMGPATVGLAATQLNIFVNTIFASQVPGAPAWLNYAFRLMQLPIGVFGVAVATIATTRLAVRAAAADLPGLRATLVSGLKLVAFFTVPAMVGLVALRVPIVRLLYAYGEFGSTPLNTFATADAVLMYALGLYAYSAVKVVAPAFYALDRSRIPLFASISAVIANLVLNTVLFAWLRLGHEMLALGTAAGATMNFAVLLTAFRRTSGSFGARGVLLHLAKVLVASLACGAAALGVVTALESLLGFATLPERALAVLLGVGAGVAVYGLACHLMRVPELGEVLERLLRRRRS